MSVTVLMCLLKSTKNLLLSGSARPLMGGRIQELIGDFVSARRAAKFLGIGPAGTGSLFP